MKRVIGSVIGVGLFIAAKVWLLPWLSIRAEQAAGTGWDDAHAELLSTYQEAMGVLGEPRPGGGHQAESRAVHHGQGDHLPQHDGLSLQVQPDDHQYGRAPRRAGEVHGVGEV